MKSTKDDKKTQIGFEEAYEFDKKKQAKFEVEIIGKELKQLFLVMQAKDKKFIFTTDNLLLILIKKQISRNKLKAEFKSFFEKVFNYLKDEKMVDPAASPFVLETTNSLEFLFDIVRIVNEKKTLTKEEFILLASYHFIFVDLFKFDMNKLLATCNGRDVNV